MRMIRNIIHHELKLKAEKREAEAFQERIKKFKEKKHEEQDRDIEM